MVPRRQDGLSNLPQALRQSAALQEAKDLDSPTYHDVSMCVVIHYYAHEISQPRAATLPSELLNLLWPIDRAWWDGAESIGSY